MGTPIFEVVVLEFLTVNFGEVFFLLPGDQRGSNMACPEIDESGSWVKS